MNKSKTHSWFAGIVVCGLVLTGCSNEQSKTANKKNESKSTSPDTTKQSSPKSGSSDKNTTPAKPIMGDQFPRPEAAEKPMYTSDTNTVMFHQSGNVDDQAKFYTDKLVEMGWTKADSSEISDGVGFLDFSKGKLSITVTINPLSEGKITTIAQGSGLLVPESLEDDFDDSDEDNDE